MGAVKTENKNSQELNSRKRPECRYCGYNHANRQCPAYGQICRKCGQKNHFKAKCRLTTPHVNTAEEVFRISQVGCGSRAMITMEVGKPSSHSQVSFQLDTGAECNLLSLKEYRRVTGDVDLKQVNRCSHKFIKTYTNERYRIMGSTELPIWRHGKRDVLLFNITEEDLATLLSYSAPVLNWGLSQFMTVIALLHQIPTVTVRPLVSP